MTVQATKARIAPRERQPYAALESGNVHDRFTELIDACAANKPHVFHRNADTVEEILFEAHIGGVQYYLVRCQPQSAQQVQLSPREVAIARLIAKGLPNKSIGDILDISPWTVATHLRRIFTKLGVTSRAAMVARLIEEHWL